MHRDGLVDVDLCMSISRIGSSSIHPTFGLFCVCVGRVSVHYFLVVSLGTHDAICEIGRMIFLVLGWADRI